MKHPFLGSVLAFQSSVSLSRELDSVVAGWKKLFVEFFAQFFWLIRFELWNFATVVAFSGERVMLDEK